MPSPSYVPKGKKVLGHYWLKPQTKNKMQWILCNSKYSDYFANETSLVDQSIAFMYFAMTNPKYSLLLEDFLMLPVLP